MSFRVTYLSPYVPYPSIPHAGGQFLHRYLEHLAGTFDVTVVAPSSAPNRAGMRERVPVDVRLVPVRRPPRTRIGYGPRLVANTVAGVTPGWHVLRAFRRDPAVWERVRGSDLVELQWAWYLPFVRDVRRLCPRLPVTAFEHDVVSESLSRRASHGRLHERTLGRLAAARAAQVEPALLNLCDTVFAFSERDRAVLLEKGVRPPVQVVSPPVRRRERARPDVERPVVLFVGAMDRPENSDGAIWLAAEVWPGVSRACPAARLVLAGTSPPPGLQRLRGPSVEVTGYVDDLEPLYRRAMVFVAPNLTGAGVKFKVLDALGHGLPVVATPIAAEGIADGPSAPGFAAITSNASTMAGILVELLSSPERAGRIGDDGRAWVGRTYDFDASMATVAATYERLISDARAGRRR